tara:strand:+ start:1328 stop:2248 length:921 start_codon:yes stop_codon:yes gene_type:complete
MRNKFIETLSRLVEKNKEIILLTGDLGFGVFDEFSKIFPENFINVGVAEQNMTGIASGLALEKKIVFTYSIANFSTLRCLEQIRNSACYHDLNVNVVSIGGGFSYGPLGISHHATEDLSIMRSLPNIKVISPSTLIEVEKVTELIVEDKGTTYLRLDKSFGEDRCNDFNNFSLGKARMLSEGTDCTIFVTGGILEEVWKVYDELQKKGYKIRVVSVPTIKPLDKEVIKNACNETGGIICVEENTLDGGLGSAVGELILDFSYNIKKFLRIGLKSQFSSIVGSQSYLRKKYNLDSTYIAQSIIELLK